MLKSRSETSILRERCQCPLIRGRIFGHIFFSHVLCLRPDINLSWTFLVSMQGNYWTVKNRPTTFLVHPLNQVNFTQGVKGTLSRIGMREQHPLLVTLIDFKTLTNLFFALLGESNICFHPEFLHFLPRLAPFVHAILKFGTSNLTSLPEFFKFRF